MTSVAKSIQKSQYHLEQIGIDCRNSSLLKLWPPFFFVLFLLLLDMDEWLINKQTELEGKGQMRSEGSSETSSCKD